MSKQWLKNISLTLVTSSLLTACQVSPPSNAEETTLTNIYQNTKTKLETIQNQLPPSVPPSLVNIGIDQSGSMQSARVSPTQWSDLEPILNVVSHRGGIVAVSAICDRSNRPLVRVTFNEPLPLNITSIPEPPQRPDTSKGSPFEHQKLLTVYRADAQKYQDDLTKINQQLDNYQEQIQQIQTDNKQRMDAIKPEIETILNHDRTCQATDIQSAINRANLLFNEDGKWSQTPRKYAVFITDGLDTFSSQPAQLTADMVILVNGSADIGIFQSISHERFESPQAALSNLALSIEQP